MTKPASLLVVVGLSASLALTACTGRGPRLDGSWGDGTSAPAQPSISSVELNILGEELTGNDGCAPINARVRLEGNQLMVSDLRVAAIGCPGDDGKTGAFVQDLLASNPQAAFTDENQTMTLTGTPGSLTVKRR